MFPSRESAIKTLIAEAVRVWIWCFQLSFLSNQNPSHHWTSDGSMHVPLGRTTFFIFLFFFILFILHGSLRLKA